MRMHWSPLRVKPSKTIYLVSKLHPQRYDIWLKLSSPIFRLDFETMLFRHRFNAFLVIQKELEPLQIVSFLLENQIKTTKPFPCLCKFKVLISLLTINHKQYV